MATFALLVFAYFCGSIPTGVWLARRRGVDPRDIGSGNIGATNVARAAGNAAGVLTLFGDTAKGLFPVLLATKLGFGDDARAAVALAAFAGHIFPCFLRFQGGKGVAVSLGVLLGLAPLGMAISVPIFLLTVAISRYVSLGSILSAAATPLVLLGFSYPAPTIFAATIMGIAIAYRHRDNMRRIRFGTEARVGGRSAYPSFPDSGYA